MSEDDIIVTLQDLGMFARLAVQPSAGGEPPARLPPEMEPPPPKQQATGAARPRSGGGGGRKGRAKSIASAGAQNEESDTAIRYVVLLDAARAEQILQSFDEKDYLRLKPDRLHWTPFTLIK